MTLHNKLNGLLERLKTVPLGVCLVVVYYVLIAAACVLQTAFVDRNLFAYDISMFRAIVCMSVSACAIWLIVTRARRAGIFCIVGTTVFMLLSIVDVIWFGAYAEMKAEIGSVEAIYFLAVEHLGGVAVVVYCVVSNAFREYLGIVPPEAARAGELARGGEASVPAVKTAAVVDDPDELPLKLRIRTWPFWRNTAIYFIVFSMLGHWAEMLFCRLIILGVFMGDYDPTNAMLWDQWLFPFSAEGIALVMVVLVLHPLKERLLKRFNGKVLPAFIVSFLINQAVCTSIDFLTGMAVNQDYSLWDYRALPFNFMGQVCLQNSLVYTVAATVIVWWVYPAMERFLERLPRRYADGLFFALVGMYAFLAMLYFVEL